MKREKQKREKSNNWFTRNYFFVFSLIVLLLSIAAFSDNLFFDVGQPSNSDPKFIIHGLIMFCWYGILVVQTNRIRKLNYKAHRRLGISGFIVASLVILSIAFLYIFNDTPWDKIPIFGKANRVYFPVFIALIATSYWKRDKPEWHKHAIIVAILLFLEPLLGRSGGNLGVSPVLFATAVWFVMWLSLFIYDIVRLRRLHVMTYTGFILWLGTYLILG